MEIAVVLRMSLALVCVLSTSMALTVESVYSLWTLSSDLVFVLLFPQLLSVFFLPEQSNAYGSVVGFFAGALLRTLSGEKAMGVPVMIQFPLYSEDLGQRFPFRTFCMLFSLTCLLTTSTIARFLFEQGILPESLDVCNCFRKVSPTASEKVCTERTTVISESGHLSRESAAMPEVSTAKESENSPTWKKSERRESSKSTGQSRKDRPSATSENAILSPESVPIPDASTVKQSEKSSTRKKSGRRESIKSAGKSKKKSTPKKSPAGR